MAVKPEQHWDFVDEDGCLHCNCGRGVVPPDPKTIRPNYRISSYRTKHDGRQDSEMAHDHQSFVEGCYPCDLLQRVAEANTEVERLQKQVAGMRATLEDFADPDHWVQNDDGEWVWHGYYPPFERPAVDLLGTLGHARG